MKILQWSMNQKQQQRNKNKTGKDRTIGQFIEHILGALVPSSLLLKNTLVWLLYEEKKLI
jgi:hypothetical protein